MNERKVDEISGSGVEGDDHPDKCNAEEINPSRKNWKIKLSFSGVPETFSGDKKSIKKMIAKKEVGFLHTQAFRDIYELHRWEDDGVITLKIEKEGDSLFITVKHNKFDFCTLKRFEEKHLEIFNNPSYKGKFSIPKNEKCPPKTEPGQPPNGGMLPDINREPVAIAETASSIAGKIDEIYTMDTIRVPPKKDSDANVIDIPEFTQPPEITPSAEESEEKIPLFDTPRGDKIYRLDFSKLVIRLKKKKGVMEDVEKMEAICEEEGLEMKVKRVKRFINITIIRKEDAEYGDVMKNIENAIYLEGKNTRLTKK